MTAAAISCGQINYPVFIHENIIDDVARAPTLRRRLSLTLQHLASMGRTSVVKGCAPPNRGWRRTPMGGSGGMAQYLWWTHGGSQIIPRDVNAELGLKKSVWVRSLRQHDDMRPLSPGDPHAEYMELTSAEITGDDPALVESPWTEQQRSFIRSPRSVRVVYGHPGSGKTTALWQAVSSSDDRKVLYTSWSAELLDISMSYLRSFAPGSLKVLGYDFNTLLGMLCGHDLPRMTMNARTEVLSLAIADSRISPRDLGPWNGRHAELCSEMRAVLFGMATDDRTVARASEAPPRLTRNEYIQARRERIDPMAVNAVMKIAARLERDGHTGRIFPDLLALESARDRLRQMKLPDGLEDVDRLVIDEIQDLSMVEIELLTTLVRAIGAARGQMPSLLISGDEGQTVSPSGFDWGPLSDLLTRTVGRPTEFGMETKLRTPRRISDVIDRTSRLYKSLRRELRPANQSFVGIPDALESSIYHCVADDRQENIRMLKAISDMEGAAIITLEDAAPRWIPQQTRHLVLSPAEVKGLEFRTVCVLEPAVIIENITSEPEDSARVPSISHHASRTRIDRLRVAISRATETLIFADTAGAEPTPLSAAVLGEHIACRPDELMEYIGTDESAPEDLALSRIEESKALMSTSPRAAWNRALHAVQMLGVPGLPNSVADRQVIQKTHMHLLSTGAALATSTDSGEIREDLLRRCRKSAAELPNAEKHLRILQTMEEWMNTDGSSPIALLNAALETEESVTWLTPALRARYQAIQTALGPDRMTPKSAARYTDNVENWLSLAGYAGNIQREATELRLNALDVLVGSHMWEQAQRVLSFIPHADASRARDSRVLRNLLCTALLTLHTKQKEDADEMVGWYCDQKLEEVEALTDHSSTDEEIRKALDICDRIDSLKDSPFGLPDGIEVRTTFMRANAQLIIMRNSEALGEFTRLVHIATDTTTKALGYLGAAAIHYMDKKPDEALSACIASLNLDPDARLNHTNLGASFIAMSINAATGRYRSALAYGLMAQESQPDNAYINEKLAISTYMCGLDELTIRYVEAALNADSEKDMLWFMHAVSMATQENYHEALESMSMIQDDGKTTALIRLIYEGFFMGLTGEYNSAMARLDRAALMTSNVKFLPLLCRAEINEVKGEQSKATKDTLMATQNMDEGPEAHALMAEAFYIDGNAPGVATETSRFIDKIDSTSENINSFYLILGHALMRMGYPEAAWERGYRHIDVPYAPIPGRSPFPTIPADIRIRRRLINKLLGLDPDSRPFLYPTGVMLATLKGNVKFGGLINNPDMQEKRR